MYIKDGIAFAEDQTPALKVTGIRPLDGLKLWLRFNTGEARIFDCGKLVDSPAFVPLRDPEVFRSVYIDYGMPVWKDGEIDIDPAYLYAKSTLVEGTA